MPKGFGVGGLNPASLWGKPLPGAPRAPEKTGSAKRSAEPADDVTEDDDDIVGESEIDVDAELSEEEPNDGELQEVDAELGDDDEDYEDSDDESEDDSEEDAEAEDDYEHDYEPEEGDESAELAEDSEAEEVVSAVDHDEDQVTPRRRKTTAGRTSTRGKSSMATAEKKMSLSDYVRKEIDKRQTAGASLRGKDIVEALEKRGITVSAAQVSQLLKKAGLGGKPRAKRADKPAQPVAAAPTSREAHKRKPMATTAVATPRGEKTRATPRVAAPEVADGFRIPMAQLKAAEVFVAACDGSFEKAGRILTTAQTLSQTFGC